MKKKQISVQIYLMNLSIEQWNKFIMEYFLNFPVLNNIYICMYVCLCVCVYIYIIRVLVVTKSLCRYVLNQVQYNMESAQYLG